MTAFDDGASLADQDDREILTWSMFGDAARSLAQQVVDSAWLPDVVVAVARGGLLPAGAVAYALGVKAMSAVNVEYPGSAGTRAELVPDALPVFLPPLPDVRALAGRRVLVVDDVADSGRTLALVMDSVVGLGGPERPTEARSAVVYMKPSSVIRPDYVWRHTPRWITFPWSALPPISPLVPQDEDDAGAQQP